LSLLDTHFVGASVLLTQSHLLPLLLEAEC
jgi:hypothetical protein